MIKPLYFDTNIFIYLSDNSSPYYSRCSDLLKSCEANDVPIATSTETIQEIIHYAINTKQLLKSITLANKVLELVDYLYPVSKPTIELYLLQAQMYKTLESRDLIHFSVCLENRIKDIATYDKKFKTFKNLRAITPEEILNISPLQ